MESILTCCSRRQTYSASRSIPTEWRRGSSTSPNGAHRCCDAYSARQRSPDDPELELLYNELASYPGVDPDAPPGDPGEAILIHRLRLRNADLTFFSTVTTFGTATDIALAELAIEAFYPANEQSAAILRGDPYRPGLADHLDRREE